MLVESAGPTEIRTPQPSIQIPVEKKASFFGKMFGKSDTVETTEQKVPDVISLEQEKHLVFFVTDGEAFDQEKAKAIYDFYYNSQSTEEAIENFTLLLKEFPRSLTVEQTKKIESLKKLAKNINKQNLSRGLK